MYKNLRNSFDFLIEMCVCRSFLSCQCGPECSQLMLQTCGMKLLICGWGLRWHFSCYWTFDHYLYLIFATKMLLIISWIAMRFGLLLVVFFPRILVLFLVIKLCSTTLRKCWLLLFKSAYIVILVGTTIYSDMNRNVKVWWMSDLVYFIHRIWTCLEF